MNKLDRLKRILGKNAGVVVAFSGGVDSTFLLKVAKDVLGNNVIAATAVSVLQPEREIKNAVRICRQLKVPHVRFSVDILAEPKVANNSRDRCYHCKSIMLRKIILLAKKHGFTAVEGTNFSDLGLYRPGLRAVARLGMRSPLVEARFTKDEIRAAARRLGLPNWNAPALACLASRVPYGHKIDRARLRRIERAENYLIRLGFSLVRVRDHFPLCRIETGPRQFNRILRHRGKIVRRMKGLGYAHATLDLDGFRTGSFDRR